MTDEKALEILEGIKMEDDEYILNCMGWVQFYKNSGKATLDGTFTVEKLEAILHLIKK